jgi:hypothetical protein
MSPLTMLHEYAYRSSSSGDVGNRAPSNCRSLTRNPTSATTVPAGDDWSDGPKLDSYRAQIAKKCAQFGSTRRQGNGSHALAELGQGPTGIACRSAILRNFA